MLFDKESKYPKTFVIYRKCLLDWKIKIEEEYYKPPGKPFVEFHYENKHCEKSTYTEKYSNKIAYRLDDKWFDGYEKQKILIIDKFTGSQLYFSTLLKILSGQQRYFDIKGAKEINHVKHVIITSNKKLNNIYKSFEYNEEQFDWQINAIWHYKKSDTGFSERKCEKNPYLKQLH
ncbi:14604_t:CDS:2, partial [Cetraspora pellucida]